MSRSARSRTTLARRLALCAGLAAACGAGEPQPAPLDTRHEQCASCRMAVSDTRFASQLVARGELPRFFDDLGCLRDYLQAGKAAAGATAYVADHRTRQWARAGSAVFTRVPGLETPMGSHLVAHADAASRDQDPSAHGGAAVAPAELFGAAFAPDGRR